MFHRTPRVLAALFALAVVASACSSDTSDDPTTTTTQAPTTTTTTTPSTTTSTTTSSTTSTVPTAEVSEAINGLPADDALIDRRMVAVKIDNHPNARPQSGIEQADAVFEVLVEGGLTRFIAMFHQSDVEYVGPNRSGRITDGKVMTALGESVLQISGAQPWVQAILASDGINVSYDNGSTTYRVSGRPAPHNLYSSTLAIRDYADARGWPDEGPGNLFVFGDATPGEAEATTIAVPFSDRPPSTWAWDGERYLRFQGNSAHEWIDAEGETGQVAYDTLVVMKMDKYIARDPAGVGSSIPTVETVGTGEALVFHHGEVLSGTWERGSLEDPFTLLTPTGSDLVLPTGTVWVHLVPDTFTVTWE